MIQITKNIPILGLEGLEFSNEKSHGTSINSCQPSSANYVKKIRVFIIQTMKLE